MAGGLNAAPPAAVPQAGPRGIIACASAKAAGTEHFFTKGGRPAYPPQNTATSTGMVRMDKIVLRHTRRTA